MGDIVLHAGMGKTGSSSIQQFLSNDLKMLRDRWDIRPVRVCQSAPGGPIDVVLAEPGATVKSKLVDLERRETRAEIAKQIFAKLDSYASRGGTIVLSSEGYQLLFWDGDSRFFDELNSLATAHTVRVAYYVRPQHTGMESSWRQWGFRHPDRPSTYLTRHGMRMRYFETLETVRQGAPNVSFEMRPFRADLLEGGEVVTDFCRVFLGIDDVTPPMEDEWVNRALPFELLLVLRDAPPGMFWPSPKRQSLHGNKILNRLRTVVSKWDVREGQAVLDSRRILQRHCHRVFEPSNQQLIKELGWNTEYFVPPPDDNDEGPDDLALLDDLWKSKASAAQKQMFFCALRELLNLPIS